MRKFRNRMARGAWAGMLSAAVGLGLAGTAYGQNAGTTGPGVVTIVRNGDTFTLLRDGQPYYIKGVGGQTRLDLAAECGANSTRTWTEGGAAAVLAQARSLGMTATIGVWLDHGAASYKNEGYKAKMRQTVQQLVATAKNQPAMLIYALGNETNSGADTPEAWSFINELALICHKGDPKHPTMTVLAGSGQNTINNVANYAPAIDILGVNSYGGIVNAPRDVESSAFRGPYIITEWGPHGHWEVPKTSWGAPIEQTSAEKAKSYKDSYELIYAHRNKCVGSYVFLWGQKEERTPTWYGMFVENNPSIGLHGELCPTVDVMAQEWSGRRPANVAPSIVGASVNGSGNYGNLTVHAGTPFTVAVRATDADGDPLTYSWEVLKEATQLGSGGSGEGRPERIKDAVKATDKSGAAQVGVGAAGNYRVYVYVLDGKGNVATMNIPFQAK